MKKFFLLLIIFLLCNSSSFSQEKLSREQIKNLTAFAKLYGYVKYFHPSDEAQSVNWNSFVQYGSREILKAASHEETRNILKKLFTPVAPTLIVYTKDQTETDLHANSYIPEDTSGYKIIYWRHLGNGIDVINPQYSVFKSYIINKDSLGIYDESDSVRIGDYIDADLGNGLLMKLPLVLYFNGHTFPRSNKENLDELQKLTRGYALTGFSQGDKSFALADVIILWNVLEHFGPYFDVIEEISSGKKNREEYWKEKLDSSLSDAYQCTNEKELSNTLSKLVAGIEDGHGYIFSATSTYNSFPPFKSSWVQNSVVVTEVLDSGHSGVKPGDIITKINDDDINTVILKSEALTSSSTKHSKRYNAVEQKIFLGELNSDLKITLKRDGKEFTKSLKRNLSYEEYYPMVVNQIRQIKSGIFYVDLGTLSYEDIKPKMDSLVNAKGIIFDLRTYPYVDNLYLFQHFSESNVKGPIFMKPILTRPDYQNVKYKITQWDLPALTPKINSKIIFLVNGTSISYQESVMSIVENYKFGKIYGEATAGTNGNINPFVLPGDFTVWYSGMKVLKQDGSRYHGIGVKPTVPVERTIKGIKAGKDEILEKAVEDLSK